MARVIVGEGSRSMARDPQGKRLSASEVKAASEREERKRPDDPMPEAPRSDLVRMGSRDVTVRDGMTLVGYPVVFDKWTEINSWEGRFLERIAPTALTKTLAERGDKIKVLFNHGMDPDIGDKPLGKPSVMRTDSEGLYVDVPLSDTSYNRDLAALLRDGAIDGMSFRFGVVSEDWEKPAKRGDLPKRTITELRMPEFGPVTFPAYEATSVGIRARDDFTAWKGLDDLRRTRIEQIMRADSDEDPAALAEGVDAVLDELSDALATGDVATAAALCVAAETTIDALIVVLGGVDADEEDVTADPPAMGMYAKSVADLQHRTSEARKAVEAARNAPGAAASTPQSTTQQERQTVARRIRARRILGDEQAA